MQVRYFVVDAGRQLRRASRDEIERLWDGSATAAELSCAVADEFRLITVLCDDELEPVICYFLRLELENGRISDSSKIEAFEAVATRKRRRYDSPAARRQFTGWPEDWQTQLAVALDVPAAKLQKLGLGGPLLLSELWGIPLEKVLRYFEEAHEE
jgi:hypothetical protein